MSLHDNECEGSDGVCCCMYRNYIKLLREAEALAMALVLAHEGRIDALTKARDEWRSISEANLSALQEATGRIAASQAREANLRGALEGAVKWALPMSEAPVDARPYWFDVARRILSIPADGPA